MRFMRIQIHPTRLSQSGGDEGAFGISKTTSWGRKGISQLISAEKTNTNPRDVSGVASESYGITDLTVGAGELLFRQKNTSWGCHGL